jgi:hypothetical protein
VKGCLTRLVVFLLLVAVVSAIAMFFGWQWPRETWAALRQRSAGDGTTTPSASSGGYVCEVTDDAHGAVPKKVVLLAADVPVFAAPSATAAAGERLSNELFATLYVFAERESFVKVGRSPHERATLGWIRTADVLAWNTREGLDPVVRQNHPLPLWDALEDARSGRPHDYLTGLGGRTSHRVLRILGRDGDAFHVAILYDEPGQRWHATAAWTGTLDVGFDAKLVYFVTKAALADDQEGLQDAWFRIEAGDAADHPLVQFMRRDLGIRFGPGADADNPTMQWLQEKARALHVPIAAYALTPAEMRRDLMNKETQIARLAAFLRDDSNWDENGAGWLPAELAPLGAR